MLARSIIDGMTRLCEEFGRAIVIEDDLIVSPHILEWFNTALDHYADDDRVMQISGHMFDSPSLRTRKSGIFLPFTSSWGWATWKRAWDVMDEKATGWEVLNTDRKLRKRFDIDGVYPYTRMLNMQMRGEIDSWAIRWYWSMFRKNGLALYPPRTLVKNIGTDDRATHGSLRRRIMALFHKPQSISSVRPSMPDEVAIDRRAFSATKRAVLFRRI